MNNTDNSILIDALNDYNVIFVSYALPPEHSGAGKRIFNFYNYLKLKEAKVRIITSTKHQYNDVNIFQVKNLNIESKGRKLAIIINFFYFAFQLIFYSLKLKNIRKRNSAVWLVSANPLTFAASIVFHLQGFKVITQNTLLGSDDPGHKYAGDLFNLKYRLKRLQYRFSDKVTCISPLLYEKSIKYHPNVIMIPNPVDLEQFKNTTSNTERRLNKKVLIVGSIGYRKGSDIVLKTIKEVHQVDPEIKFIFVGPNNELQTILEKENLSLNDYKNVDFIGYALNPMQYFKEASLFFLPSRREGFGMVFIEAMAAGLPVVAKEIKGITDYIFPKEYFSIIDSDSSIDFAHAIISIINSIDTYKRLIDLGEKYVFRFEKIYIFKEYLKILL